MVQDGEAAAGWAEREMGIVGGVADSSGSSGFGGHAGAPAEEVADFRKGPWTVEEDLALVNYIAEHGEGRWNALARAAGLKRTGKSCRLRWLNYLRPDVRRGNITPEEQLLILQLHSRWGNRWSKIAEHLPGRTDNEIKNYWRTRVKKHAKHLKCDANSQQFKDIVRQLWIPRLVEKIQEAAAAATPCTTTASVDAVMAAEVANPGALAGIGADANGSPDHPNSAVTSADSSAEATWLPAGFAYGYDGANGAGGGERGGAFPGLASSDGGALFSDALMSPRGYLNQGLSDVGTSWWADAVGCMSPENWWTSDDDYWFLQHAQL